VCHCRARCEARAAAASRTAVASCEGAVDICETRSSSSSNSKCACTYMPYTAEATSQKLKTDFAIA